MTSFAVQTLVPMAPLGSKEKGSIGNRIDCTAEQFKNKAVTGLQAGAVVGAGLGADYLVRHSDKAVKFGTDVITKTKGASQDFIKVVKDSKAADAVKNTITKLESNTNVQNAIKTIKDTSNESIQNAIKNIKEIKITGKAEKLASKGKEAVKNSYEYIKNHMPKTNNVGNKVFNSVKNIAAKVLNGAKNLGPRKLIGLAAGALLTYVVGNGVYKSGQIDQKYTDKAKFQQTL